MHFSMGPKTVFLVVVVIAAISIHHSEAAPKIELLKAKLALKKLPHIAAKVAVAKEVKTKVKIAAVKTLDALKAKKIAALSIITAPFRKVKKAIAFKIAGLKAAKALKIAKLAAGVKILKNLKKSPIILPVAVAVPAKDLKAASLKAAVLKGGLGAGIGAGLAGGIGSGIGAGLAAPIAAASTPIASVVNPFPGIISGAARAIQSAGAGIPFLSTLTGGLGLGGAEAREADVVLPVASASPTYRFVPEVGFSNYNQVSYQPEVEIEVPSAPELVQ